MNMILHSQRNSHTRIHTHARIQARTHAHAPTQNPYMFDDTDALDWRKWDIGSKMTLLNRRDSERDENTMRGRLWCQLPEPTSNNRRINHIDVWSAFIAHASINSLRARASRHVSLLLCIERLDELHPFLVYNYVNVSRPPYTLERRFCAVRDSIIAHSQFRAQRRWPFRFRFFVRVFECRDCDGFVCA